jgi:membrane protein
VEGPTIYGSLAAPVAVLLWIGVSAFAVLVGAAVNAALDRVWPSVATAAARAAQERVRTALSAEYRAWAAAHRALGGDGEDGDEGADAPDAAMPSEFPERWSKFLPPEDVTSRLRTHARRGRPRHGGSGRGRGEPGAGGSGDEDPGGAGQDGPHRRDRP